MRSRCEVRRLRGMPTLYMDGRPHPGMMWYGRPNSAGDFARAGVHLCTFSLMATEAWWIGPNKYDFQSIDRLVDEFVDADPRIRLMPRIHLGYGDMAWWAQQHAEELAAGRDARGRNVDYFRRAANDVGCPFSFASATFVRDAARALEALVHHLEAREGGRRVFGYHLAGGISAEWFAWWTYLDGCHEDFSAACRAAFRAWLRRRYGGRVAALRRAWGRRGVSFATADVPGPELRGPIGAGALHDPRREQAVIDYQTFFSEQAVETIGRLARRIKRACDFAKIVGVFYGYTWPHWNNLSAARQGHAALERLLRLRAIDFVVAPYHYDHRGIDGVHGSQTLLDANHAAGKLHVDEIDTFTHLTRWPYKSLRFVRHARTPQESRRVLRRDGGALLAKGGAAWWMDLLHQHWHGHPAIVRTIAAARRAAERQLRRDRRSVSQIGVFVDQQASVYLREGTDLPYGLLTAQRQFEWPRIGAPVDERLVTDLLRGDLPDYRLCIFPNLLAVTPELRRAILRYVRARGRWTIWFYAPGVFESSAGRAARGPDFEAAGRLVGMRLGVVESAGPLRVRVRDSRDSLVVGPARGLEYGMPLSRSRQRDTVVHPHPRGWQARFAPRPYVDDDAAESLGTLVGTTRVGLAVRRTAEWTSLYSSAPGVPAAVVRRAAREAGVHLWTDEGCVVHANRSFLSVKREPAGVVEVRLPRSVRVKCVTGQPCRQEGRRVRVRLAAHDTAWLELEPG